MKIRPKLAMLCHSPWDHLPSRIFKLFLAGIPFSLLNADGIDVVDHCQPCQSSGVACVRWYHPIEKHMLLGFGIKLTRFSRPGYISFVVSFQSASSWADSLNEDMMAWLWFSAVESSAMIDPERQIDFNTPLVPCRPTMTFTNEICRRDVLSVCSCFLESAEPSQYAARYFVVQSNVDLMFRILLRQGSSWTI